MNQVKRSKFISSNPQGAKFMSQVQRLDINKQIGNKQYDTVLNTFVRTDGMDYLQDKAYARKEGYAIGYVNGKKVMYVSGSRNIVDWIFNAADDFIPAEHHYASNRTAARLTRIAKRENVDVVVGHSRGGMLVAKMDIPNNKKLALDGAIRLAPKDKRGIMNLYQKQPLDKFISRRGGNRKGYKMKRLSTAHFISRDRPGYKGAQYGVTYKKRKRYDPRRYVPFMKKKRVYWDKPYS